jgi:hypothetical protein
MNGRVEFIAVAFVVAGFIAGCSEAARPVALGGSGVTVGAGQHASLTAAHEAYLVGDYVTMGERVRDVLLDVRATKLAKENALEVLDKAYAVSHGALPSRFRPPAGVTQLQYLSRQFVLPGGQTAYQVRFAGTMQDASKLVGITVRHLPDGLVMDKRASKGTFEVRRDPPRTKVDEFVLDSPALDAPLPEGVVTIRLELEDGTVSEGFLLSHGLAGGIVPTILSPGASESVTDPNPLLRWASPIRSGAIAFEQGRTVIHLTRSGEGVPFWMFGEEHATAGEVHLGSAAGSSAMALVPGTYDVFVSPGEHRAFGPIEIGRACRVSQMFHVVAR